MYGLGRLGLPGLSDDRRQFQIYGYRRTDSYQELALDRPWQGFEASYREIADALFGARRIERETWKTSSLRDRTIRLVKSGIDLMRAGYRRLLRGR